MKVAVLMLSLALVGVLPTSAGASGDCVADAARDMPSFTGAFVQGGVTVVWLATDEAGLEARRRDLESRCPGASVDVRAAPYARTQLQLWADGADVLALDGVVFVGVGDREARIVVATTGPDAEGRAAETMGAAGIPADAYVFVVSSPARPLRPRATLWTGAGLVALLLVAAGTIVVGWRRGSTRSQSVRQQTASP